MTRSHRRACRSRRARGVGTKLTGEMTTEDRAAEREAVSSRAASRGRLSDTVGSACMLCLCATVVVVVFECATFFFSFV